MIKFGGFDKNGHVLHINCKTHCYYGLPKKGLGKSMDGVNIDEPVIIPQSVALDGVSWGYTEAEIVRRAFELKSDVKWMKLSTQNCEDEQKFQMWFSDKD